MGVDLIGKIDGIEVMIDEDLGAGVKEHLLAHGTDALGIVEVGADEEVGIGYELVTALGGLLIDEDVGGSGHPIEEGGEGIRHNDLCRFVICDL